MSLPARVIREDARLDAAATTAQEELARLRWHWTLDESNPERVAIREYARAIGRHTSTVAAMANGYAAFTVGGTPDRSLGDHIEMAGMGETRRAAAVALADAQGTTVSNVTSNQRDRIRETVAAATDAAERKRTTVAEEIPRVALAHTRTRVAAQRDRDDRKARASLRYIEIEGDLAAAKRRLTHALDVARDVAFGGDELALLRDTVANLAALLRLIDLRLGGAPDIDWDAELAKLEVAP